MPGRDGTGPSGKGPFTGQGLGFCICKLKANTQSASHKSTPCPECKELAAKRQKPRSKRILSKKAKQHR